MTKVANTPWTKERSTFTSDGEFDYAILAKIDGKECIIGEFFGRVDEDVVVSAKDNAERVIRAINGQEVVIASKCRS